MDIKELAQQTGLNINTVKTYIYRLKKKGFGVGRKKDGRLEFDERDVEVLREVSRTSIKEFLERHKTVDIVKVEEEKAIIPERFLEELTKRDMVIDELLERVEALESQISEMQNKSFWNRIRKLFGRDKMRV